MRIFAEGVNSGIARSSIPAIARHLVYIYCDPTFLPILIVNSLRCAEVPLRNCSLTHSLQLQLRSGPSQKYFFFEFVRKFYATENFEFGAFWVLKIASKQRNVAMKRKGLKAGYAKLELPKLYL